MNYDLKTFMKGRELFADIPGYLVKYIEDSYPDKKTGKLQLQLMKAKEDEMITTIRPILNKITNDNIEASMREIYRIPMNEENSKKFINKTHSVSLNHSSWFCHLSPKTRD